MRTDWTSFKSMPKFSNTSTRKIAASQDKSDGKATTIGGRTCERCRINRISRLRHIGGNFQVLNKIPAKLLLDTGPTINVTIKQGATDNPLAQEMEQEHEMGNDIHKSKFTAKFNVLEKNHLFHVIPDSFPIPEDSQLANSSFLNTNTR